MHISINGEKKALDKTKLQVHVAKCLFTHIHSRFKTKKKRVFEVIVVTGARTTEQAKSSAGHREYTKAVDKQSREESGDHGIGNKTSGSPCIVFARRFTKE